MTTTNLRLPPSWFDWTAALLGSAVLLATLFIVRLWYRLYFHPLAKFPGSRLAAISTPWYEWYWNVYQPGQMLFEIERLHQKHGPIVRVGVNELHVDDPEYYITSTNTNTTFLKDPLFYADIGFPHAILGMIDPEVHRIRKQVLAPAFSTNSVQEMSPHIAARVEDMCERLQECARAGRPANMHAALKAYAMDMIYLVALGKDWSALKNDDFYHPMMQVMREALKGAWIPRAFPLISKLVLSLPHWLIKFVLPVPMIEVGMAARSGLEEYLQDRKDGKLIPITTAIRRSKTRRATPGLDPSEPRMVSNVIERELDPNSAKGYVPLCLEHLNEEVLMTIGAGNDTTSTALIEGLYSMCKRADLVERLQSELGTAFPSASDITYARAKQLPFLNAVAKETMRYSSSIPGRLPRVIPIPGVCVDGKLIPAGAVVHTSPWISNRHPAVWGPDAYKFEPDRWLGTEADVLRLDKYHATFHRGSRMCLGINLAYCELYLLYANLFRRFDIIIHDTTDEDMKWTDHSFKVLTGKQLHALVKERC